jgi:microcystin-dependent protein
MGNTIGSLQVVPGYQLGATEILTTSIFNQMAKPTVVAALGQSFTDLNYFRNGNFYTTYWTTPAGLNAPAGSQTVNAQQWFCQPNGSGNVNYLLDLTTPDALSLNSAKLVGATGITDVLFGQQINYDLSATLRQVVTFSCQVYNGTSSPFTPTLQVATANSQGNFAAVTVQAELTLPSCAPGVWTYVTFSADLSVYSNMANGVQLSVHIPTGVLNSSSNFVRFDRMKVQPGGLATGFTDDTTLFVSLPTIQTTNLANGCVTQPKLDPASGVVPVGGIIPYAGASAPSGWLLCNGQAVSRTTFSVLFGIVGTTYGIGDGSTTFNVPNLVVASPVGVGSNGNGTVTLGQSFGSASFALVTANLPAHNHPIVDPGHVHSIVDPGHAHNIGDAQGVANGGAANCIKLTGSSNFTGSSTTGISVSSHTTGITTSNTGTGTSITHWQPSLGLNWIIKT